MASELREAFASAGPKVEERRTGTGRAYVVGGRVVGQVDETPGSLRVRMWLVDKDRSTFEGRPTFDSQSGWIVVVSDDDVAFVKKMVPDAYRAAAEGKQTATPAGQATRTASPPSSSERSSSRAPASGRPSRSRSPRQP